MFLSFSFHFRITFLSEFLDTYFDLSDTEGNEESEEKKEILEIS